MDERKYACVSVRLAVQTLREAADTLVSNDQRHRHPGSVKPDYGTVIITADWWRTVAEKLEQAAGTLGIPLDDPAARR